MTKQTKPTKAQLRKEARELIAGDPDLAMMVATELKFLSITNAAEKLNLSRQQFHIIITGGACGKVARIDVPSGKRNFTMIPTYEVNRIKAERK